ncbi:MAG: 30S ribosomal protein S16 [Limnochordia bacterium]
MAVRIRLKRMGAKKRPYYRLVVADSRTARNGAYIETLGSYDPISDPVQIDIDNEKAIKWLQRGAQPSDTAKRLLTQSGVFDMLKAGDADSSDQGA